MQKSNSADNQQAIVSEAEKGWLAGLIDGEGCIHIDIDKNGAHPYLTVTNSNFTITEKVVDIWHKLGIGCRVQTRHQNIKWNPVKDVQIIGYKRLKPALIAIMPYLVGKSDEALLMYRFVESRLGKRQYGPSSGYTDSELALVEALKTKKLRNRVLRDYTPDHLERVEDIVRATRRRVEAGRNAQPRLISE
ncbi:MAG: LAGLIDADG family homing endonuclease [Candidatus Bathyarchaeota archaeon]|nr:LAGLIDADG family homing endonuclease [Candidatus Bathyarchaeota archaeon]